MFTGHLRSASDAHERLVPLTTATASWFNQRVKRTGMENKKSRKSTGENRTCGSGEINKKLINGP